VILIELLLYQNAAVKIKNAIYKNLKPPAMKTEVANYKNSTYHL